MHQVFGVMYSYSSRINDRSSFRIENHVIKFFFPYNHYTKSLEICPRIWVWKIYTKTNKSPKIYQETWKTKQRTLIGDFNTDLLRFKKFPRKTNTIFKFPDLFYITSPNLKSLNVSVSFLHDFKSWRFQFFPPYSQFSIESLRFLTNEQMCWGNWLKT